MENKNYNHPLTIPRILSFGEAPRKCCRCGREIVYPEARYAGQEYKEIFWHYACWEAHKEKPQQLICEHSSASENVNTN